MVFYFAVHSTANSEGGSGGPCVALCEAGLCSKTRDMYKVYILVSIKDKTRYVGVTSDLVKRLKEHNSGETKSNKSRIPYKLIYYCSFHNKIKAYEFERYLKSSSGHAFTKKHLI